MECLRHQPGPPLGQWVDHLWALRDAPAHRKERIVPSGTLELVLNLAEDEIRVYDPLDLDSVRRHRGSVVSGAFSRCFVIDTREHNSMMGVHFKPGGAAAFLSVPADELADGHVELESLWPVREVRRLRERLCAEPAPSRRFRLLEEALMTHLSDSRRHRQVIEIAAALLTQPGASVRQIAGDLGVSHRHFIAIFSAGVGITPKLFGRVLRFQRLLALIGRNARPHWALLANECGYFDQSHLIRDFLAFSGVSPTDYAHHLHQPVKDNHIPIL